MTNSSIPYRIEFLDTVDSTNNYLKERLRKQKLHAPFAVSAAYQSSGRGQRDRQWVGNKGQNISVSFLVDAIGMIEQLPALSGMIALAVKETLEVFGLKEVKVKWPNDIFVGDRKIAGILIENVIQGQQIRHAIIGVGLNVNQRDFGELNATSIALELELEVELTGVLHRLYDAVYGMLDRDPESVLVAQNQALYKRNEVVTFKEEEGINDYEVLAILHNGNLKVRSGTLTKEIEHHKAQWII